ncbi:hypothetical protein D3C73_1334450 [compost metagenome]
MLLVSVRECARRIEHGAGATLELDNGQPVVHVTHGGQVLVNRNGAAGERARGLGVAQHPARQIDIMHAAIHEDAARGGREGEEAAVRIKAVAGLRAHQEWPADVALPNAVEGVGMAGVETPDEAHHGDQVGSRRRGGLHPQAIRHI